MPAVGMHFDVICVLKSARNSCKKVHVGCGKARKVSTRPGSIGELPRALDGHRLPNVIGWRS
jgi:hypothetical protein